VTGARSEVDGEGIRAALLRLDAELFRRTAERSDPVLDRVLPALSRAADFSLLWLGIAAGLALSGRRRAALRGLASVALASATTNAAAKLHFRRVRPPLQTVPVARRVRRVPVTTSFPSGHSASAAAFATAVGLEAPELAGPVGLLAAGVAWSRVWTGAHYPGDVAVGAVIGGLAAVSTGRPARRRRPGRSGGRLRRR
jgi:membrane-associated phospholipid phosphatase